MTITPAQLKRLQVLYRQYEAHSLDAGPSREERMAWAGARVGRRIESFSQLTLEEGKRLIDGLQRALGTKVALKTPRRRPTRRDAEKMATEGRHDQLHAETTLVDADALARIQRDLDLLGWDKARLDAFLASPKGPNHRSPHIRTLGEANRVHWALKRLASRPAARRTTPTQAHATS